jgi:hypothetical protein
MSRFTGRAVEHEVWIDCINDSLVILPWRWDLPIDLYPSAPPDTDQG